MVCGDTRFHDPNDTKAPNPTARVDLVQAIAEANPVFICITGDIVYNGNDSDDWKVWDNEARIWREKIILVYAALGNHDLHGDPSVALGNYFQRFPELKASRYYSVRAEFRSLEHSRADAVICDSHHAIVNEAVGRYLWAPTRNSDLV